MPTLADIEGRVLARAQLRSTDTLITQAVRYQAINTALQQVSLEKDWPWLSNQSTITTVANQPSYLLPLGFLRTLLLFDDELGYALNRKVLQDVLSVINPGRPAWYAYNNTFLVLGPLPSGAFSFTHYYTVTEPHLTAATDSPLMPEYAIQGVVEMAARDLLRQKGIDNRALSCEAGYQAWKARIEDNNDRSTQPTIPRVRRGGQF